MLSLEILCKQSVCSQVHFSGGGSIAFTTSRSLWRPKAHSRGVPINVSLPLGGKRPHRPDSDQALKVFG